jgi:hypothetical protein
MSGPTIRPIPTGALPDQETRGAREWRAPTLKLLGDTAVLTGLAKALGNADGANLGS